MRDFTKALTPFPPSPRAELLEGGVELIAYLENEWRALCQRGPCDQPFFRPEWFYAYARAFAPKEQFLILTVRRGEELAAVLPLLRERSTLAGLPARKLLGVANVHSCRFDLICDEDREHILPVVWEALKKIPGWDALVLPDVPEGGALHDLLPLAEADGYPTGRWESLQSPFIRLPEENSLKEPFARGSTKFKANLRRRLKHLREEGEVRLVRVTEALPEVLERFYQLEKAGWKGDAQTAIACSPKTLRFYQEIARAAERFGYLSLYALNCGARTIAMHYGLLHNGRYFLLKPAYDEEFRRYSPGQILTWQVMQDLVAQGVGEFDFLGPQMDWKRDWEPGERAHYWCYIFRKGVAGRLLSAAKFQLRPALKRALQM